MRYQHDLRFVRMNVADGTVHCERHGPLPPDEVEDVYRRSGLTASEVQESARPNWVTRFQEWLDQRHGPRCMPVARVISMSVRGISRDPRAEALAAIDDPDSYWDGCKYRLPTPSGERPFETDLARRAWEASTR
jgi:hypothetical protein